VEKAALLSHGELQIHGLSGLRNHTGKDWPKSKDNVFHIIRQMIKAHLDKHDIYAIGADLTNISMSEHIF